MNISKVVLGTTLLSSILLSSAYASKQMVFKTEILPVCGIEVDDAMGSINFSDSISPSSAAFTVQTNHRNGYAIVSFTGIDTTDNITNKDGYFEVLDKFNNKTPIDWNNPQSAYGYHNEKQEVFAMVPQESNTILAGTASVTTTLEVRCD